MIEVLYNPTNTTGGPGRSTFQQIATRRRCSYWHSGNVQAVNKAQFGQEILQTHGGFLRHGRPPVIIHLLLGFSMKSTICFVGTISFMETPHLWNPPFMETHIYGNSHVWKPPYDSCIRCFEMGEYMNMLQAQWCIGVFTTVVHQQTETDHFDCRGQLSQPNLLRQLMEPAFHPCRDSLNYTSG